MICKCLQHRITASRDYVEPATSHTAIACWQVTHGPQPKGVRLGRDQFNRAHSIYQQTPVTFTRLA